MTFECDDDVIVVEITSEDSYDLEVGSLGFVVEGGSHPVVWFDDIDSRQMMYGWQLEHKNWR